MVSRKNSLENSLHIDLDYTLIYMVPLEQDRSNNSFM